jgi:hypothetical protein
MSWLTLYLTKEVGTIYVNGQVQDKRNTDEDSR